MFKIYKVVLRVIAFVLMPLSVLRRFTVEESLSAEKRPICLLRFGDGEAGLLCGEGTIYEKASYYKTLALIKILRDPNVDVALPVSRMRPNFSISFLKFWLLPVVIYPLLTRRSKCYDAFMFRSESGGRGLRSLREIARRHSNVYYLTSQEENVTCLQAFLEIPLEHVEPGAVAVGAVDFQASDLLFISYASSGKILGHQAFTTTGVSVIDLGSFNFLKGDKGS